MTFTVFVKLVSTNLLYSGLLGLHFYTTWRSLVPQTSWPWTRRWRKPVPSLTHRTAWWPESPSPLKHKEIFCVGIQGNVLWVNAIRKCFQKEHKEIFLWPLSEISIKMNSPTTTICISSEVKRLPLTVTSLFHVQEAIAAREAAN